MCGLKPAHTRRTVHDILFVKFKQHHASRFGCILRERPRSPRVHRCRLLYIPDALLPMFLGEIRMIGIAIAVAARIGVNIYSGLCLPLFGTCLHRLLLITRLRNAGFETGKLHAHADHGKRMPCIEIKHRHKGHPFPLWESCRYKIGQTAPPIKARRAFLKNTARAAYSCTPLKHQRR